MKREPSWTGSGVGTKARGGKRQKIGAVDAVKEQYREVNRRLHPEYVAERQGPGRQMVSYLKGSDAVNLMNDIFGPAEWFHEIRDQGYRDKEEREGSGRWTGVAWVLVRVTVRWSNGKDNWHDGMGTFASKMAGSWHEVEANARKAAATDALKRAIVHFGNALGNCIYDVEYRKWIDKLRKKEGKVDRAREWSVEELKRKSEKLGLASLTQTNGNVLVKQAAKGVVEQGNGVANRENGVAEDDYGFVDDDDGFDDADFAEIDL